MKTPSRQSLHSNLAEINITPLVDVMLVLLIIFMVTAPMMQRGLDVNLPQSRRAQEINDQQRLYVTVPLSFRKDRKVRVGDELVPFEALAERVRQAMRWRSEKQVFLQCDGTLTVQEFMDVADRLKEGGVEHVGIVAKFPETR
jgi:biopolymer transport protein ExbD/biopolymer transport protein TolR